MDASDGFAAAQELAAEATESTDAVEKVAAELRLKTVATLVPWYPSERQHSERRRWRKPRHACQLVQLDKAESLWMGQNVL